MGRVSDLFLDIESLYWDGYGIDSIMKRTGASLELVEQVIELIEENYRRRRDARLAKRIAHAARWSPWG